MNPKKIWSNLAVADLDRTIKFYTALGFRPNGKPNEELCSFLVGEDNFVLHFFLSDVLARSIKGELADTQKVNELLYTLSASSKEEVDSWEEEIRQAGGSVISQAEAFGPGYYGFLFADPDGHRYNVFYMEGL